MTGIDWPYRYGEHVMLQGKRKAILTGLVLSLVATLVWWLTRPATPPDVILVSIDTLRADHLGCYGYTRNTSPALDRLAREGARFETVISSTSWTLPAHAALFTSLPDSVHGCDSERRWLDGSRTTVAEAFRKAGYRTAGFYSGPLLHRYFGLNQSFDTWEDRPVVSEFLDGRQVLALRTPGWKLIFDFVRGMPRVYDLTVDPGERTPLPLERTPVPAGEIRAILEQTVRGLKEAAARMPVPEGRDWMSLPEVHRRHLKSLGYLK
jgi:sulfatase-like protein